MKRGQKLFYVLIVLLCHACSSDYPEDVQEALKLARRNVVELERVLNYYKTDSLKYKAACFLIANMPYHGSREEVSLSNEYVDYFTTTDSLFNLYFGGMTAKQIKTRAFKIPDSIRNRLSSIYNEFPQPVYSKGKKDIETVSADFLIDNIETAFSLWRSSPLLKDMSFDEFKESVLPYRATDEPLLYKKSELRERFHSILSMEGTDKITVPIERYKNVYPKNSSVSVIIQSGKTIWSYMTCSCLLRNLTATIRLPGLPTCSEHAGFLSAMNLLRNGLIGKTVIFGTHRPTLPEYTFPILRLRII